MRSFTFIIFLFSVYTFPQTTDMVRIKSLLSPYTGNKDFILSKSTAAYSILSSTDNNGFVIISSEGGDDVSVLGYSDSGIWDEKTLPPALLQWLNILEENYSSSKSTIIKHENNNGRKDIPVLMKSKWHQDTPYNNLCPVIIDGNIKTAAGCVAIAASQVAYYWRKDNPQKTSENTPTYPYGKAPVTYSVPAGTDYQWDLMKDYYTLYESDEEKDAVARLVYIVGTSTYLQYGVSTGGQINDIINPFSKQLRLNAKFATKKNYSQGEWEQLIYNNLIKKQPVVYAGSTGDYAHAVVIDGYMADLNLFHFNFGWGGNGDGYYTINDASGMNGYSLRQECVYDIYPRQRNMGVTLDVEDNLYVNTQGKINISIRNGSTIDIEGLYLFVSAAFTSSFNKDEAIWHYNDVLKNDDINHSFTVDFFPTYSSPRVNLFLTDGDMNILAQKRISINEGGGNNFILGDVNGDGKVDVSDYIGVANKILGITQANFDERAGDIDKNGVIDVSDYLGVGDIILKGSSYGSRGEVKQKLNIKTEQL